MMYERGFLSELTFKLLANERFLQLGCGYLFGSSVEKVS